MARTLVAGVDTSTQSCKVRVTDAETGETKTTAQYNKERQELILQAMLEQGMISQEEYDRWRYHYPEFDKTQNYVKVPPQDLF